MKILLTVNKTLSNGTREWEDGSYWNLFLPLQELGHEVYFYDTVRGADKKYSEIVDIFKPDLIFCCMTGDPSLTPHEPWEEIATQTKKGNCATFNWFCDDTWRFNSFSSKVCNYFHACSTPEISYLDKFKNIGYDNIFLGFWHSNKNFYKPNKEKKNNISFCGQLNYERKQMIDYLNAAGLGVKQYHGLPHEEMLETLCGSKIGINFSKNYNGRPPVLQMKGRMVEVPAANSLLLTEYAPGIEEHFVIDQEIVTFKSPDEMVKKAQFLLSKPNIVNSIAKKGHQRFIKDHDSVVRLEGIIGQALSV